MAGSAFSIEINAFQRESQTLLELLFRGDVALHDTFQFMAGVKCDDISGLDRNRFASARIAPWTRRLAADVEVAETGELDVLARHQRAVDDVEEGLDHVLGLAL